MSRRVLVVAALMMSAASSAWADSFVLRPPSSLNLDFEGNGFRFVGDGFSAVQDFESTLGLFFGGPTGCDPCRVGETHDPSLIMTNTFMGNGTATVGSTTYSNVAFFGDLAFNVTPQPFPGTDRDGFVLRMPFIFTGTLRGFMGDQLAFSVGLTGNGLTDRFWDNNRDGRFFAGENRFTFFFTEPAAAATPEPASLLLLATGIAGLAARRRMRRADHSTTDTSHR